MAEEKQERKKVALFWRILKWIGLAVLSVLIILGLIFEAPWKIIALLLIVLAACRILPKPAIKWFWLTVGVVIIALIIWVLLPDENGDWRPYTFDEELAALEAARAIPDEENAATIYNKLLETYDANAFDATLAEPNVKDLPMTELWSSKDYPKLAEWLKGHQNTIETLMEVVKKEKCRFPVNVDYFVVQGQWTKRLPAMRRWAYLLIYVGNNDLGEGRYDAGLEKYLCIIRIARHLYQQPTIVDFMVGLSIERLALIPLNRFVIEGEPSKKQIQLISNSIRVFENNWSSDWGRILDSEKLLTKNFWGLFYEINTKGKVRLSHYKSAQLQKEMPPQSYWQRKLTRALSILPWFFMPSSPQKAGEIINTAYEKYFAMAEPDFDWQRQPTEIPVTSQSSPPPRLNYRYIIQSTTEILEESFYGFHDSYLRGVTLRRGSRLLPAIKQYKIEQGNWPESLDAIKSQVPAEAFIDPATGKEIHYENHGKRFSLYGEKANIWPK
jgi:hypothetical protein